MPSPARMRPARLGAEWASISTNRVSISASRSGSCAAWRLLREKADTVIARQFDLALFGLDHAADQVEQRRFADAVAADKPDLCAIRDLHAGAVEQPPLFDTEGNVL